MNLNHDKGRAAKATPPRRKRRGNAAVARSERPKLGLSPGAPKTSRRERTELHGNASMEEDDTRGCRRRRLQPRSEQSSYSKHPHPPKVGRTASGRLGSPYYQATPRASRHQHRTAPPPSTTTRLSHRHDTTPPATSAASRRPPNIPPPERPRRAASTRARRSPPSRRHHETQGRRPGNPTPPEQHRREPQRHRKHTAPPTSNPASSTGHGREPAHAGRAAASHQPPRSPEPNDRAATTQNGRGP